MKISIFIFIDLVNKLSYCVQTTTTHAQNNYASSAVRDIQRRNQDMEYQWGLKRVQKELDRVQELNHQMLERLKILNPK